MIAALILGRKGSCGLPNKNLYPILGHPLAWYPMKAAHEATEVDKIYISTDDTRLMEIAGQFNAEVIVRPDYLCTAEALGEDAYKHGYEEIVNREKAKPEILVLLFCNAATVLPSAIDEGIDILRKNPNLDSAVTVSRFNMYSPIRARRITHAGLLEPFIPFASYGKDFEINCDRDCQGDVWFADCSLCVIRPRNLENVDQGMPPQKWMGNRIYPLKQEAGCDVDAEWQIAMVEWWLKNNKFPID